MTDTAIAASRVWRAAAFALLALSSPVVAESERAPSALQESILAQHNEERRARGVAPLVWSEELALAAERSARRLALEPDPIAVHGKGADTDGQGENLWAGTRDAFAYHEMTEGWLSERTLYVDGPVPDISRTGNWADVGHYSQIIWSGTRHVGCALVNNERLDLLVCRYDPAGNIYGRRASTDLAAR